MDTETLQEFVQLEKDRRKLESELKSVKSRKAALEERLLTEFEKSGVQNMRIDGMTVYVHRQTWASHAGNPAALVDAMRAAGMDEMVKTSVNTQTLSAWVRELQSIDEPIPAAVEPHISVSERFSLRTNK